MRGRKILMCCSLVGLALYILEHLNINTFWLWLDCFWCNDHWLSCFFCVHEHQNILCTFDVGEKGFHDVIFISWLVCWYTGTIELLHISLWRLVLLQCSVVCLALCKLEHLHIWLQGIAANVLFIVCSGSLYAWTSSHSTL